LDKVVLAIAAVIDTHKSQLGCREYRDTKRSQVEWSNLGATNFTGKRPTASELTTTAGRVFLISEPMVGSNLTSQISPRLDWLLVLNDVTTLPLFAVYSRVVFLVVT